MSVSKQYGRKEQSGGSDLPFPAAKLLPEFQGFPRASLDLIGRATTASRPLAPPPVP